MVPKRPAENIRGLHNAFARPPVQAQQPYQRQGDGGGQAGQQRYFHGGGEPPHSNEVHEVIGTLDKEEVAQVHAEGERRHLAQHRAGLDPEPADDGKDGKGHQEDVDAGEVPEYLKLGILAGEVLLRFQEAEERDGKADQEEGNSDGEHLFPAPGQRVFGQVMGQHHVPQEAGKVIEHAVRVPVANAQNAHVAVIAFIAQRRGKHLEVGESHAEYPDAQEDFHILPFGLRQPRAHDGHEEVETHQHVYVPQGRGVIVEVEEKGVKLADGGAPGVVVHHDVGAGRMHARGKVAEVEQGKHQGPDDERNQHPFEALGVKSAHFHGDGKEQHAGDHGEQRHARPHQTAPEDGGFKVEGAVKTAYERIAAMGHYNEKTGQDAQEVNPGDVGAVGGQWLVGAHGCVVGKIAASSRTFQEIYPFPGNVLSQNGEKKQKRPGTGLRERKKAREEAKNSGKPVRRGRVSCGFQLFCRPKGAINAAGPLPCYFNFSPFAGGNFLYPAEFIFYPTG